MSEQIVRDFSPVPPQSLEAERSVLGALLQDPDVVGPSLEVLKAEDFFAPQNQAVYEKIRASVMKLKDELQERGEALIAEFRAKALAEAAGGETETASEAEGHVENIRQTLERFSESLDETLRALNPQLPAVEG